MNRIVMTGMTGTIGSKLRAALHEGGGCQVHQVRRMVDCTDLAATRAAVETIIDMPVMRGIILAATRAAVETIIDMPVMRGIIPRAIIHCAGMIGPIGPMNAAEMWDTLNTNIVGTAVSIQVARDLGIPKVITFAGGGVGGDKLLPRWAAYYSSKAGVVGLIEHMAVELPHMQINAIAPGAVPSEMTREIVDAGPDVAGELYYRTKAERESGGSDFNKVINMVRFLLSEESNHVSGRYLSAQWDAVESIQSPLEPRSFKLRRVVP